MEYKAADGGLAAVAFSSSISTTPKTTTGWWSTSSPSRLDQNGKVNRRPDVVVFVNGLPLAVIELKNAADENATIWSAFNQLQTYKAANPGPVSLQRAAHHLGWPERPHRLAHRRQGMVPALEDHRRRKHRARHQ